MHNIMQIRVKKKNDFDRGMIVGYLRKCFPACPLLLKNKEHAVCGSYVGKKALLIRLIQATVTEITMHYSSGMQKSISEHTTN